MGAFLLGFTKAFYFKKMLLPFCPSGNKRFQLCFRQSSVCVIGVLGRVLLPLFPYVTFPIYGGSSLVFSLRCRPKKCCGSRSYYYPACHRWQHLRLVVASGLGGKCLPSPLLPPAACTRVSCNSCVFLMQQIAISYAVKPRHPKWPFCICSTCYLLPPYAP